MGAGLTQSPPYSWRVPLAVIPGFAWYPGDHRWSVLCEGRDTQMPDPCIRVLAVPSGHFRHPGATYLRHAVSLFPMPRPLRHSVPQYRAWRITDLRAMGVVRRPTDRLAVPRKKTPGQGAPSHRPPCHCHGLRNRLRGWLVFHQPSHRHGHCAGSDGGVTMIVRQSINPKAMPDMQCDFAASQKNSKVFPACRKATGECVAGTNEWSPWRFLLWTNLRHHSQLIASADIAALTQDLQVVRARQAGPGA